jgi:hypothetical protein
MESEQGVREELKKAWSSFSVADKRHCVELAKTGGESSNTELLTCLEMARDVRVLRSAAAGGSASDTAKPEARPPTSAAQPALGGTTSQPTPLKEPPKATGSPAITEVERVKAEAETAKASEALAQRKLADAEALCNAQRMKLDEPMPKRNGQRPRNKLRNSPRLRPSANSPMLKQPARRLNELARLQRDRV